MSIGIQGYPMQGISWQNLKYQQDIKLRKATEELASGSKINRAADDASGLAISERQRAQMRALTAESDSWEDRINMNQSKDGYLESIHGLTQRLGELANKSANVIYTDDERKILQMEVDQYKQEINRISETANFNNNKIMQNVNTDTLNLTTLDISSIDGANAAIDSIKNAVNAVSGNRAAIGAENNALSSRIDNQATTLENLSLADSRIRDTDYAEAMSRLTSANVMSEFSNAVYAQGNVNAEQSLRLLM
ncbi:MAG: hypothetical protein LBL93_00005 [Ruminococcus sp.]|jgi:flagellin|nr:hypothetical protein [Ruminococcus sp.]